MYIHCWGSVGSEKSWFGHDVLISIHTCIYSALLQRDEHLFKTLKRKDQTSSFQSQNSPHKIIITAPASLLLSIGYSYTLLCIQVSNRISIDTRERYLIKWAL